MMTSKSEQTLVGLFVLVTIGIVIAAAFFVHGAFGSVAKTYHAYFPFAGGLEPGATVRYLGGPRVGRVDSLRVNPQDPSRIDITFSVQSDTVVKTDSKVKIMSMSPLGDNHLELLPGSAQAPAASPGSLLGSENYIDFNVLTQQISNIAPQAQQLLRTLNDRATELKVTLARVNDLLNDKNRSNLSATLAETRGMIADSRPQVHSVLQHVNDVSEKLGPLIDDFRRTANQASETLSHVDSMIGEDRPEIHQALIELQGTLKSLTELTGQLNQTLDVNSENIDQLLENMVRVTENLKGFTETIKDRPSSLILTHTPREHKTGEPQ
jgi:phospholipid/cholesterol/gamma-HCH transport system substrate-binding protein